MKLLRRFAITLAALVALYVFVDTIATNVAEDRIASVVQRELGLADPPEVTVTGFPVLIRALFGSMSAVTFEAKDVTIGGLRLRRATARFEGLKAPDLLNARKLEVTVARGTATGEVTDAELNAYLERKGIDAKVSVREGTAVVRANRRIFFRTRAIAARGPIKIEGRRIVFEPRSVSVDGRRVSGILLQEARRRARFAVAIPELPGGARAERVEMHKGYAALVATLADQELRFG